MTVFCGLHTSKLTGRIDRRGVTNESNGAGAVGQQGSVNQQSSAPAAGGDNRRQWNNRGGGRGRGKNSGRGMYQSNRGGGGRRFP